jgi:Cu(I)/Ag(I) efflux system membrane protein CusA/SilA
MIARIIEFSIRNRGLVILAWVGIAVWGGYAVLHTPVDAIPDLSENQVIVFADWMGRSPQEIEDQITYPLSVQLQGLAGVRTVRSSSEPNFSMIGVIFDDKTDPYFARTRILERLTTVKNVLPADVTPQLAPDANALGQIFWYTVEGAGRSLDELRAVQDFTVRYQLSSIPGVAEVASVGGFVREYQVDVDPAKLRLYDLPLSAVYSAIANSNMSVGAKAVVQSNTEYLIRGLGWLQGVNDLEAVEVVNRGGVPVTLKQLAAVQLGPEFRRSALEKDGQEAVGGVVMMRFGQNPLEVTKAIHAKIREMTPGLPEGVRVVPFYERTRLIESAIRTVTGTLKEEMIIASIAVLLILTHLRSAVVVCVTLPMAVLVSFLFMYYLEIPSNIMSLCGIAISIGILVDAAVVMVENASHQLKEQFGDERVRGDTTEVVVRSCRLVGRPIFFSVVIMLISFLPIFGLRGMEGKLAHPLAFTKSFAMVGVAVMAITLVPALIPIFLRGRLKGEEQNPIVRSFIHIYRPVLTWMVDRPAAVWWLMAAVLVLAAGSFKSAVVAQLMLAFGLGLIVFFVGGTLKKLALIGSIAVLAIVADTRFTKLGSEFKPELDEGSLMDMPSASPRIAMAQAVDDVRLRNQILRSFPEVEQVVGKIGRAETATDPSPVEMVETVINLRPVAEWPRRKVEQEDVTAQARRLASEMRRRRWLKGDTWGETVAGSPDAELIHTAADAATAQLDRATRGFVRRRQDEQRWVVGDALSAEAIDVVLRQARANGGVLREPTVEERGRFAETVREQAYVLAGGPRQVDVDALLARLRGEMAGGGVVANRDDLLSDRPGPVGQAIGFVRRAAGMSVPAFPERVLHALEAKRLEMTGQWEKAMDHDLFDFAVPQLNQMLIDALLRSARGTAFVGDIEPTPEEVNRLAEEESPALGMGLFLWAKTKSDLQKEMDGELQMPGWGNTWTQPIQNRVNMLSTGVRTQIGVKVFGPITAGEGSGFRGQGSDKTGEGGSVAGAISRMQAVSDRIAAKLRTIPGAADVVTDQAMGKRYIEIRVDRERLQRYGVNIADVNQAIETAMGGSRITTTVEGRQRFPVRLRYARDYWQDPETIGNVLVTGAATPAVLTEAGGDARGGVRGWGDEGMRGKDKTGGAMSGGAAMGGGRSGASAPLTSSSPQPLTSSPQSNVLQIPLKMLADIRVTEGPAMIKSENGRLRNYVTLNVRDRDLLGFVEEARQALRRIEAELAGTGMSVEWSGDFEHQMRTNQTMAVILPAVFALILLLLYVTFRDLADTMLVLLAVVGALCGAVMFQALFGFNFSVVVWIGYVAAFGMATQTGVIMLVYLRESVDKHGGLGTIGSLDELRAAVIDGAVHRLRPKLLTEGVAIVGLVPMLWATGTGAEIMRPMAAPVLGGLLISDEVIDLLIPVLFYQVRKRRWLKLHGVREATDRVVGHVEGHLAAAQ